jgi:hypothetical protein
MASPNPRPRVAVVGGGDQRGVASVERAGDLLAADRLNYVAPQGPSTRAARRVVVAPAHGPTVSLLVRRLRDGPLALNRRSCGARHPQAGSGASAPGLARYGGAPLLGAGLLARPPGLGRPASPRAKAAPKAAGAGSGARRTDLGPAVADG